MYTIKVQVLFDDGADETEVTNLTVSDLTREDVIDDGCIEPGVTSIIRALQGFDNSLK